MNSRLSGPSSFKDRPVPLSHRSAVNWDQRCESCVRGSSIVVLPLQWIQDETGKNRVLVSIPQTITKHTWKVDPWNYLEQLVLHSFLARCINAFHRQENTRILLRYSKKNCNHSPGVLQEKLRSQDVLISMQRYPRKQRSRAQMGRSIIDFCH